MRIKLTNARSRVTTQSDLHSGGGYTNTLARIDSACTFKLGVNCLMYSISLTRQSKLSINTGLLAYYHSHVDNRYKRSLLTTMIDRAYRLSSTWLYFSEECERSKALIFSRLDYPHHLINSTINTFINSSVADQQPLQASGRLAGNDVTRVVMLFKDQDSANIKIQLKDLSIKLQNTIQPLFVSRKIGQDLKECERKLQLVDQQCVVYHFKCKPV